MSDRMETTLQHARTHTPEYADQQAARQERDNFRLSAHTRIDEEAATQVPKRDCRVGTQGRRAKVPKDRGTQEAEALGTVLCKAERQREPPKVAGAEPQSHLAKQCLSRQ